MSKELQILNMVIVNEAKALMGERLPTMISYFLEDTQMYLREIEKALQEQNIEIAIAPAHTIKSSAKQLGLERVSSVAKEMEELSRMCAEKGKADFAKLTILYDQLTVEFNLAIPELNKLC